MSKNIKTNSKQNKKIEKKLTNENKRRFEIIGFTCSIILLLLLLVLILKINTSVKSETSNIMKNYSEYFESSDSKVIIYFNSQDDESGYALLEIEYLNQLSKDYKIDFLPVDISLLNKKNRDKIESELGIEEVSPTIVVVKDSQVLGVQKGFIESHNLVKFFIDVNILDKDAKYSAVDNLKFIDYNKYKELLNDKKKNVIIIGQAGCNYCKNAKSILNNVSKAYKIDIYYLDIDDIQRAEAQELFNELPNIGYNEKELTEEGNFSMPTLFIVKKGQIVSYLQELKSLDEYISYLKENEMIE